MPIVSQPLLFDTYLRPQIWGGVALARSLGKGSDETAKIGEAWELSTLQEHLSRVTIGPCSGESLVDLWARSRLEISGTKSTGDPFPWLVKWLDCTLDLSLQVHPSDDQAQSESGLPNGKSEVWIVVHASPDARIVSGIREGVSVAEVKSRLHDQTIEQCLNSYQPQAGDCISLPAGTIHTARGVVLAEVQQPSDATFRLFDWNRRDASRQTRTLHLESGLRAINWSLGPIQPVTPILLDSIDNAAAGELLLQTSWVRLERHVVKQSWPVPYPDEMTVWMVLEGNAMLFDQAHDSRYQLQRGTTVLIPAAAKEIHWSPRMTDSSCTLACIRRPQSKIAIAF
jgi:mannose-6-phosphate isomerase